MRKIVYKSGRILTIKGLSGKKTFDLSLRGFPKFGTSKTLILNGLAFFHA